MKNKYGNTATCAFCGEKFVTKPRFLEFCSTPCKNPINRAGHIAWNKGLKLTEEQKVNLNLSGLKKGHGWNKGVPNERQREKWLKDNPNANGKLNNLRPKKTVNDAFILYKRDVRKATYRTIKELCTEGNFIPKFGKYKTDLQIDHIISIKQGFELGLPASLLGGKFNIQFLRGADNRLKWHTFQLASIVRAIKGELNGIQQQSN
jgi:5-methylcytosine-specific restriction endonuclease McrA